MLHLFIVGILGWQMNSNNYERLTFSRICSVPKQASYLWLIVLLAVVLLSSGCTAQRVNHGELAVPDSESTRSTASYMIGPGDVINIFVWRNPEVSISVAVRPDGKVSSPLVEDMIAIGKTPTRLARDIEQVLASYIKNPAVTVIVTGFGGLYSQQVRVVGAAAMPKGVPFRNEMTLLDVMIEVGGLTEFAAGNKASIIREVNGERALLRVKIDDLVKHGEIEENIEMQPGDILIIPESWF